MYGISDTQNEVNMTQVNQFVNFVLNIQIRKPSGYENVIKKFRPCVEEDFTKNKIQFKNQAVIQKKLEHRICPDIDKSDPVWKVVNDYSNEEFRQSFSLMLLKCNPTYGSKCKSEAEIQ